MPQCQIQFFISEKPKKTRLQTESAPVDFFSPSKMHTRYLVFPSSQILSGDLLDSGLFYFIQLAERQQDEKKKKGESC